MKTPKIQNAVRYHTSGDLVAAERAYRQILQTQPQNAQAHYLLGSLYVTRGEYPNAIRHLEQAAILNPSHGDTHQNLGVALKALGQYDKAIASYERALQLDPKNATLAVNLGNTHQEQGRYADAVKSFHLAITINPNHAEAYHGFGIALHHSHLPEDAIKAFERAIALQPHYSDAYNHWGLVLRSQNRLEESINAFQKAIELDPTNAAAYNHLADALRLSQRIDEALAIVQQAIALDPGLAEAHFNYASCLKESGRLEEAVVSYVRGLAINPSHIEAHYNLGGALKELGHFAQSQSQFEHVLALDLNFIEAHNALGTVYHELNQSEEAERCYQNALEINPNYAPGHWNQAVSLLQRGDLLQGWRKAEWRLQLENSTLPPIETPQWNGSPLNGRILLVRTEQGFGDTFQFMRYLPLIKAQFGPGRIVLEYQKGLQQILHETPGVDELVERLPDGTCPIIDQINVQIPLLSLPLIFGTTLETIPVSVPTLSAPHTKIDQWQAKLPNNTTLRIGIVWAGSPKHVNDHNRSCMLDDFTPVFSVPGVIAFGLQKGPAVSQIEALPSGTNFQSLSDEIQDFTDTAAIIANLDLVIAVDTSVAHLAGAMGKPVWTLLPFLPDWRWMMDRDDSPWYPTMRLFRQTQRGDWNNVFQRVAVELSNEAGAHAWKRGDVQTALAAFVHALQIDPTDRTTVLNCADVFLAFGQTQDAQTLYHNYLQHNSQDQEIAQMLRELQEGARAVAA